MAVVVTSGELKHKVVFKQPTSSLNDEGGNEVSYPSNTITTWALVRNFNQNRSQDPAGASLVGALDFFIRYSQTNDTITKDWLLVYGGDEYTIHRIEPLDQQKNFILITAKVKTNG